MNDLISTYYNKVPSFFIIFFQLIALLIISAGTTNAQNNTICPNSDFNLGTFSQWSGCYGQYDTPCTSPGFLTGGAHPLHKIIPAPGWHDAQTCGGLVNVYPGDSYVARIGDTMYTGSIPKEAELSYPVVVSSTSYLFIYRYAVVLQSGGHPLDWQPDFLVEVTDSSGALLDSCGYFHFIAPQSVTKIPPGWHMCGGDVYWKDWTTVGMDLTPYFGDTVYVKFKVRGCHYNTHYGYAYVSAFCGYLVVNTAMCEGDTSATLTAPPGFSYLWSNGDTTASITVPHPTTGAGYSCTLTAANGCHVTIYDTLTYTVITTNFTHGNACTNTAVQFTDSSYVNQNSVQNWRWNFGDGTPVVVNVQNPSHTFANAGTFNVKLVSYSTEGCRDSITKQILVDTLPVITNNSHRKQICSNQGTNIVLTTNVANPDFTWTASSGSGFISGYSNVSTPTPGPINQTLSNSGTLIDSVTYVITPIKGMCQGTPFTFYVVVEPRPNVHSNPVSPSTCANQTTNIVLTSTVLNATFTWTATGPGDVTGYGPGSGNVIAQTLNQPGFIVETVTYHVVPTANGCPGDTGTVTVLVNPRPHLVTDPMNQTICSQTPTSINLIASCAGTTYTWTGSLATGNVTGFSNGSGSSIIQTLTNNLGTQGRVNYTIHSIAGTCTGNDTIFAVFVNPLPTATVTGTASVCQNVDQPLVTFTGATTTSPYTFTYNINGGTNQIVNTTVGNSVTVAAPTDVVGTFSYNLLSVQDGSATICSQPQSGSAVVTIQPLPTATISGTITVCKNAAAPFITFTGSSATAPYTFTYNINGGGNQFVTTTVGNSVTVAAPTNAVGSFTYNLISVQDGSSAACSQLQSGSAIITVNTLPTATISGTIAVCQNAASPLITFTGASTTPPYTFTYNINGGGNQFVTTTVGNSVTVSAPTNVVGSFTYNLISVQDGSANACTQPQSGSAVVIVNPLPTATISGTIAVCQNSASPLITFTGASATAPYTFTYNINGGGTLFVTTTVGNNVTVAAPTNVVGTFTYNLLSVQDASATTCSQSQAGTATITINPLPVPAISGAAAVCVNSTSAYATDAGMSNYIWSVSAGGTITSGTGTNSITVLWNTIGSMTIQVNYINSNGCTAASSSSYSVTVSTLPGPTITGANSICSGLSTVYTTESLMNNYSWGVSAGGSITAGGGLSDNTATVLWNTAGAQTVSVNYFMGTGCTAAVPTVYNVTVKPRPSVTNQANSVMCSGGTTNIIPTGSLPSTTFSWVATPSSGNVTGFHSLSGVSITDVLVNTGFNIETVTYAVTPSLNGCDGQPANYIVTVNPVPDVYFNPNGQSFCSGGTTSLNILSHTAGATFTWTAVGSSGNISGFGPGIGSTIAQILNNSGPYPENVNYDVFASANSCPGTDSHVIVNLNPIPQVSFDMNCNDLITTTEAKPFILKGGIPLGGTYTGTGVSAGSFFPSLAGAGSISINYSYANTWGCNASQSQIITVVSATPFPCDNTLIDPRDGTNYPTVSIGTQCWMAKNLVIGTEIASGAMQRDNCVIEKYCYQDITANCLSSGGLYQWDEMMRYQDIPAMQGICPPAWHVPTENDWSTLFNYYVSKGLAGGPLKFTGFSGYDALLDGMRFDNVNWNFTNFATFLWSSTSDGPTKAWGHALNTFNPSVSTYPGNRSNAFSIRCLKD